MIHHVLAGYDSGLRVGRQNRLKTKIEIRITAADKNGRQNFATGLDQSGQFLAIVHIKLSINQNGFFFTAYQGRGDREYGLLAGIVNLNAECSRVCYVAQHGGCQCYKS